MPTRINNTIKFGKFILTSEEVYNELYRVSKSTKRHIKNASSPSQIEYLDDIYHDSIILAHKRKMDNQDRPFGLCIFSGFSTMLRTGIYKDLKKEDEFQFFDYRDLDVASVEMNPEDQLLFNEKLILTIEGLFILFTYGPDNICRGAEAIARLLLSSKKETLASVGRTWGVSRERARQLCAAGLNELRLVIAMLSLNKEEMNQHRPVWLRESGFDAFHHYEMVDSLPSSFNLRNMISAGIFGIDLIDIYTKSFYVFLLDDFEKSKIDKDLIEERFIKGGVIMPTENKNIFLNVPNTVITIWYKSDYETIDICYGREGLYFFEKTENGWLDSGLYAQDCQSEYDEPVYYKDIQDVIENSVLDFLCENLELEEYEESRRAIEDCFFTK